MCFVLEVCSSKALNNLVLSLIVCTGDAFVFRENPPELSLEQGTFICGLMKKGFSRDLSPFLIKEAKITQPNLKMQNKWLAINVVD